MTPFSVFIDDLCRSRKIRQKEIAYRVGIDASYLSALLGGRKGPPSEEFVKKLRDAFDLDEHERAALDEAVKFSQRIYRVSPDVSPQEHKLVWHVMGVMGKLKPAQINAIHEILKL